MKKIYVVGIGPGSIEDMSQNAIDAIKKSDVIVGYTTYIDLIKDIISDKKIIQNGMRKEIERVKMAIEKAEKSDVAVISSGDAGVYGMAGLVLQLCNDKEIEVEVIPGITSAMAAAAVLGAPLMHDFCNISLSDLLTPYDLIKKRVHMASEGDFVIVIYNPKSKGRPYYLRECLDIIAKYRSDKTPVGMVKNAKRDNQEVILTTLKEFDCEKADMKSIVIVGNSNTYVENGKMITPRGYERKMSC